VIRRRHVLYVEGYDPQGAAGYHALFARELKRFLRVWPLQASVGELAVDSDDLAHWTIETTGPGWQVVTRYEFVRLEAVISANLALPIARQVLRGGRWMLDDLLSGTSFRIFRASWRFALHLFLFQAMLIVWVAISLAGGAVIAWSAAAFFGWPAFAVALLAAVAAIAIFAGLVPLAERWMVIRIVNCWPHLREFGRGAPSGYNRPVEVLAQRIVAAARSGDADEILIVGHSAGSAAGVAAVARALELDPDLGRHRPRVTYLTVGSLVPALALHPAAERMRAAIRRLAVDPAVLWVECQEHMDVMNFWGFDPVAGCGVDVGAQRHNPTIWNVRLRDMLAPAFFRRFRWSFFRLHYQLVMANHVRAPYDYFMLVCGPLPIASWAKDPAGALAQFDADAGLLEDRARKERIVSSE